MNIFKRVAYGLLILAVGLLVAQDTRFFPPSQSHNLQFENSLILGNQIHNNPDLYIYGWNGTAFKYLRLYVNASGVATITTDSSLTFGVPFTLPSFKLQDSNASNVMTVSWPENDTVDRTLGLYVSGGNRTITLAGNLALTGANTVSTWTDSGLTQNHVLIGGAGGLLASEAQLALSRGGTAANITAVNGGLIYSGAAALAVSAAGTAGQIAQSAGAAAPVWTTATYPGTVVAGDLLVATAANVVGPITAVASGSVLASAGAGAVPAYTAGPSVDSVLAATALRTTARTITPTAVVGITVNEAGASVRQVYKITVPYSALLNAGLTMDIVIAQLPIRTKLCAIYGETTVTFNGGAISDADIVVGNAAGGNQYLASFDVDTALIVVGDADAEMGTELTRAAAIQGGAVVNFAAVTDVYLRITTVGANTDALTTGSLTLYLITERY